MGRGVGRACRGMDRVMDDEHETRMALALSVQHVQQLRKHKSHPVRVVIPGHSLTIGGVRVSAWRRGATKGYIDRH